MPTVETNGIETFYHDYGSGRPLVVLHGGPADHQAWAEQLQPLTDEYRILTYDLRGHGKTGPSDQAQYTIETYVEDLAAFIDSLSLDQPAILGHSLGGMVGYVFAEEYPDSLSSLITVGAASSQILSKREWLIRKPILRVAVPLRQHDWLITALEEMVVKISDEAAKGDKNHLERLRDDHDCDVPDPETNEARKILRSAMEYFGSDRGLHLQDTPVLMLYGENEPLIEPHADLLESQLDDCRSVEIPDASHNAHADNPEFIRSKVREFLNEAVTRPERATISE
jgi:3-oxoadipate enol-lactonase